MVERKAVLPRGYCIKTMPMAILLIGVLLGIAFMAWAFSKMASGRPQG